MIRVLIADDHELFRAGLRLLLETKQDIEVAGEAGAGHETISLCLELKPDVVLLDLDLPDLDGIEVTRRLLHKLPDLRILVLTMFDSEDYAQRLLNEGAAGYMVKGTSPGELPDAIRKVAAGGAYVTPSISDRITARSAAARDGDILSALSTRELQVLIKIAAGQSVSEIARDLQLSSKTVETYKARTMNKMRLRNVSDMTRFALQHGLIKNL